MKRIRERVEDFPLPWEVDPDDELDFSDFFDGEEERSRAPSRARRTHRADRRRNGGRRGHRSRWDLDDWDQ